MDASLYETIPLVYLIGTIRKLTTITHFITVVMPVLKWLLLITVWLERLNYMAAQLGISLDWGCVKTKMTSPKNYRLSLQDLKEAYQALFWVMVRLFFLSLRMFKFQIKSSSGLKLSFDISSKILIQPGLGHSKMPLEKR